MERRVKEYHAISCSGGKDSTALVLMAYEKGLPIDEVIGCNEGKWWDEATDVLNKLRDMTGYKVTILKPPPRYDFDYLMFDHEIIKGKRKGTKGYGWPTPMSRWCTAFCKARVMDGYMARKKAEGYEIHSYIGIAADEAERCQKEGGIDKEIIKHFPLVEWGMTERDCLEYCYSKGIDFGGLYDHFHRLSCWCCPLMGLEDARSLYHYYPDKWEELKDMDRRSRTQFKFDYSVEQLEERFRLEDAQMTFDLGDR